MTERDAVVTLVDALALIADRKELQERLAKAEERILELLNERALEKLSHPRDRAVELEQQLAFAQTNLQECEDEAKRIEAAGLQWKARAIAAEAECDKLRKELKDQTACSYKDIMDISNLILERDRLEQELYSSGLSRDKLFQDAHRTIEWLRSGGPLFHYSRIDKPITYAEVGEFLESNPPEDWKP
jgi:G3E family GTPase